jgi:CxxC-x17-CxxC domain-containing protein
MRYKNNLKTYSAVCDECGNSCELPFKPSSDKPVYCSDCFKKKQRESSSRFGGRQSDRSNFRNNNQSNFRDRDRRMYPAICDSCGKRCEVPFRPTSGKPVYCDDCFRRNGGNKQRFDGREEHKDENQLKEQIGALNAKLDKIIRMLGVAGEPKTFKEEKNNKTKKKTKKKTNNKTKKKIIPKKQKRTIKKNTTKKSIKKKKIKKK